ncbi:MAG: NAD(P)-dependent oxidoreductase [Rhodocyclaceae bacterium]|nr:NAD(P)-dependent oxidoreductase [Rhodocyclaceae bacterium]MDZ4214783.1 NAD(P)-dependent oxidoreductase [Rhodocyclaceae bacterium]
MRIGYVGLGGMGAPMVGHLLAAGYEIHVWSRRPACADFLPPAVVRAASPTELARQCEIVCTNVTGTADVDGLAAQLIEGLAPDSIHVDFSTIAPSTAREIAARYAQRGSHFVDAPVSGGTAGAQTATLAIMWGGRQALASRLDPLFRCLGKTIVRVGEAGAGQVAKACNQLVMVAAIEASAEAAHLAQAAGVDFAKVRTALLGGSAASRVLEVFGGRMAVRDFTPGVEARLHHKDFAAVLAEAAQQAIPLPVAATVMQQLDALMAAGWGMVDTGRLLSVLEKSHD